jgi:hypothetical protein
MSKSLEYVWRATECIELAETMAGVEQEQLFEVGQTWLNLAQEALCREQGSHFRLSLSPIGRVQ